MPYIHEVTEEIKQKRVLNPTYSYYSKEYAEFIRPIIEAMMVDKRPRTFSCFKYGKSVGTLEKMINRSISFLVDHCDTDDKRYYNFRRAVFVKKKERSDESKNSVDIWYKIPQEVTEVEPVVSCRSSEDGVVVTTIGSDPIKTQEQVNWNDILDEFICNGESGKEITIDKLNLELEDMQAIRASVAGVSDVEVVEISAFRLTIRKR